MRSKNLSNIAITINDGNYRFIISEISKSNAMTLMKNIKFSKKSET